MNLGLDNSSGLDAGVHRSKGERTCNRAES
jgi:hypothetical protein